MVVYTLVSASLSGSAIDLQNMPILTKNHLFRWSSFWSWRVSKKVKLSHLGHIKHACTHWKADAPKTSHCLLWILVQSMAVVIGPCSTNFCSQKLKTRTLATFGFGAAIWQRWTIICGVPSKISVKPTILYCTFLLPIYFLNPFLYWCCCCLFIACF